VITPVDTPCPTHTLVPLRIYGGKDCFFCLDIVLVAEDNINLDYHCTLTAWLLYLLHWRVSAATTCLTARLDGSGRTWAGPRTALERQPRQSPATGYSVDLLDGPAWFPLCYPSVWILVWFERTAHYRHARAKQVWLCRTLLSRLCHCSSTMPAALQTLGLIPVAARARSRTRNPAPRTYPDCPHTHPPVAPGRLCLTCPLDLPQVRTSWTAAFTVVPTAGCSFCSPCYKRRRLPHTVPTLPHRFKFPMMAT